MGERMHQAVIREKGIAGAKMNVGLQHGGALGVTQCVPGARQQLSSPADHPGLGKGTTQGEHYSSPLHF